MGDLESSCVHNLEEAADVPLGVDNDCATVLDDYVGGVSQTRCSNRDDLHARLLGVAKVYRIQGRSVPAKRMFELEGPSRGPKRVPARVVEIGLEPATLTLQQGSAPTRDRCSTGS